MEAMAMGKPVIATAWSGNMAYMTHRTACLVNYRLAAVSTQKGLYQRMLRRTPAYWAEPDLRTAANWIVRLSRDTALRERYGSAARAQIAAHQQRAMAAAFTDELEAIADNRDISRQLHVNRERKLAAIRRLPLPLRTSVGRRVRALREQLRM
jgi:glycosyltransferase involved in cell wall biosynthesis